MNQTTKVKCCMTGCKYNSACCVSPSNDNCYCTRKQINLIIDEEIGNVDCKEYEYDYTKEFECISCQLNKYGEIEIRPEPVFIEVDNIEDLLK